MLLRLLMLHSGETIRVGDCKLGLTSSPLSSPGVGVTELLKRVYNDKLVEVSFVVSVSYIVFWCVV